MDSTIQDAQRLAARDKFSAAEARHVEQPAHKWRVRFETPDGYYTFVDIGSLSSLPMPKAAALAWGDEQTRKEPTRFFRVASAYSIDHEA